MATGSSTVAKSVSRQLRHFVGTKGVWHAFERTAEVLWRFRDGRRKFEERLQDFERVFRSHGLRVTFCVTTSLLQRHADLVARLEQMGHEIAAHGHVHTRMDQYSSETQLKQIERSWKELQRAGFSPTGFRCPYLNFNDDTIRSLQASRFSWTSGVMVFWQDGRVLREGTRKLDGLYHFVADGEHSSLPSFDGRIVHIPITCPDDELLFERERYREPEEIGEIWVKLFERHHEQGGLHHQFFHPERFGLIEPAVEAILDRVDSFKDEVWKPTLGELAEWWRNHAPSKTRAPVQWPDGARSCFVLSADVCAIDLWDFVDRARHF